MLSAIVIGHPDVARAEFDFTGNPKFGIYDAGGEPYSLAGGHPARVVIGFGFKANGEEVESNVKDLSIDFPPGFSGDPNATEVCPREVFEETTLTEVECPPGSQVGVQRLTLSALGALEEPIYNVEAAPGQPMLLGATLFVGKLTMPMRQRPDDFGVTLDISQLPQTLPLLKGEVELWGIPADHQSVPGAPRRPFITMPARCDQGPLTVTARARSWQEPDHWVTADGSTGVPLVGCDTLVFDPALTFAPDSRAVDSPTGATLELTMPQSEEPDDRVAAALRAVEVALPEGVSISPGGVARLTVCTDTELAVGEEQAADCPQAARVGALTLEGPQLTSPLEGSVFLGQELPGERFRLFLVATGNGVSTKFVGVLHADPVTGRLTIAIDDLHAAGFSRIGLAFDGPVPLLVTPMSCGELTATAVFERYDGLPSANASSSAEITEGSGGRSCVEPLPFSPDFGGGTTTARAGARAGLTLTLHRHSGEQLLERFTVALPPGLSAAFDSVRLCGEKEAAAAECPFESRVGTAVGAVGSGGDPAALDGDVYLTGPYRRAPFGLALVFDAAIGDFDFGTVVVRAALRVDPDSGRLSVQSDALPRTIEGTPIRFQTIGLDLDRADFVRTPTSCEPAALDADVRSTDGVTSTVSSPFHIRGCNSLRFSPRLSVGLTDAREMRRGGRPGVRIAIRAKPGEANLRSVDIGMPESLRRDLAGLRALCARRDARDGRCSADSRVGRARGVTPLFREALLGSVHLVQPANDGPPELWTMLDADGVRLSVRGRVFSRGGRMHTRLVGLPDVPLSRLVLSLKGGKGGLLTLASDPCAGAPESRRTKSALEGQNRAYLIVRRKVMLPDCDGSAGNARRAARAPVRRG